MTCRIRFRALAAFAVALSCALASAGPTARPIDVAVHTDGAKVIVDVTAEVYASADTAWAVLTDYDHMAGFLSTLKSSEVVARHGNVLEVLQVGEARRAFLHFSFTSRRSVVLIPQREIRSLLISGDFKSYEFVTRISEDARGVVTIVNHGEYVPNTWVPPIIGPDLIEAETRKQYEQLVSEIQRREAVKKGSPPVNRN